MRSATRTTLLAGLAAAVLPAAAQDLPRRQSDPIPSQVTLGFQLGGQVYSQFIFFQDDTALKNFQRGNFELGAQASAVAVTLGASADANYDGGVAVFTNVGGGSMYEATVSGQKFKYEPLK